MAARRPPNPTITALLDHAPAIVDAVRRNQRIPSSAARDALLGFLAVAGATRAKRQASAARARLVKAEKAAKDA